MQSEKPKYLLTTQKLGLKLPLAWCAASLIIGLVTQDKAAAIFVALTSFLATCLTYKTACFFFSFQEHSGILKNHVYDNTLKAIWFISLFGFIINFSKSIF